MDEQEQKYRFSWDLLGDIAKGRPNLGGSTRIETYRLMLYTFRDVLEQELGTDAADRIFYAAGNLAGKEFYCHVIVSARDPDDFIKKLQESLLMLEIGILRVEKADPEKGSFILVVSEDLDCSGLPETGYGVCKYDEGFIAGLMESFSGKSYNVKEIDCWCTGDRSCRFTVDRA
jgi:uncharacterized protein